MNTVDRLIRTREKIAKIKKEEAELAKELKEMGLGVYKGKQVAVQVIEKSQKKLDTVSLKKKLSKQQIAAHTKTYTFLQILKIA